MCPITVTEEQEEGNGSYCVDSVWDASPVAHLNQPERSIQPPEAAEEMSQTASLIRK